MRGKKKVQEIAFIHIFSTLLDIDARLFQMWDVMSPWDSVFPDLYYTFGSESSVELISATVATKKDVKLLPVRLVH